LEAEKLYRKYTISDVGQGRSYLSVSETTCTRRNYNGRRKEANRLACSASETLPGIG
jgi:hypothetical protein